VIEAVTSTPARPEKLDFLRAIPASIKPFIQSGSTAAMERHEIAAIVQPLPD
jgi:hypothetical protein